MAEQAQQPKRPRVVIIGAGFGGLFAARQLVGAPVDVLLLDRNNYHAFWPLMYQVATAGLEAQDIVQPVRSILRRAPNVQFRVATVQSIDLDSRTLHTETGPITYDELIISAGTTNNFFGLDEIEEHGFGFKEMPEALAIRNAIITRFEHAESISDPEELRRLLTFVIVGGGPTGVELAGATSELIRHVMPRDHPRLDLAHTHVVLVEAMNRLLLSFPEKLSRRAQRALEKLGVEVRLNTAVQSMQHGLLFFKDGTSIATETVIWAAGVQGSPLVTTMGVELQKGRRVPVTAALHMPDRPEVWVIGDLAYLEGSDGKPYPMLAAVAMQQGPHAARNILRKLRGQPLLKFRYVDKGTMATVGRRSAVARIWGLNFSGALAWYLWLGVHLIYLVGFRNRLFVLLTWAINYFTFDRSARAVLAPSRHAAALTEMEELTNQAVESRQPQPTHSS